MIVFGAMVLVLVLYLITKVFTSDDNDEHSSYGPQPFPGYPIFAEELFPATELQSANGKYTRTIVQRIMTTKIVQMTDPLLFYIQIPVKRELNTQRCKIHL